MSESDDDDLNNYPPLIDIVAVLVICFLVAVLAFLQFC